ncbi:ArsR/SmtB family transcription factor [Phytomonospora endophytica]|uniref:DNA-binding transcriptional ArsR family regulator n=1 Tax=Phytomonospora endophytica TaxID=714109 RepID=A0A841FR71_9ACTN|nr:winged helix-turn-helix domain-containing protein [Phytomonospora endophytica]MBB6035049.1 DNA-binding transcriptional ArsR family regulator [Phytomonospora endophytica]GIG68303.1 ArsR family transcriptional regulator [Phytomonospora endophytica]
MTLLRLSPAALARCRFALSPLAETLSTLVALHRTSPAPWQASWHAEHRPAYLAWIETHETAMGLMSLVSATKWLPDTVTPPPMGGMHTRLDDELAEVAAHTDEAVRATVADALAASRPPQYTAWLARPGLAPRIAGVFREGWTRFVAPDWPRRRAVLERDIMHRAGILAAYGWRRAVEGMTRHSVWVGDNAIRFSEQDYPDRHITDEGLTFVPHTSDNGSWTCERPPHFALVYPARGPAAAVPAGADDPLAGLLGPGRARVLRELARPATSTQLAAVLELSLGTVSAHLAVLRESGVIVGERVGRGVVYRLTEWGERVVGVLAGGHLAADDGSPAASNASS